MNLSKDDKVIDEGVALELHTRMNVLPSRRDEVEVQLQTGQHNNLIFTLEEFAKVVEAFNEIYRIGLERIVNQRQYDKENGQTDESIRQTFLEKYNCDIDPEGQVIERGASPDAI